LLPTRGDGLLTTPQAAKLVGVSPSTYRTWRQRGHVTPDGLDERGRPLYSKRTAREGERIVRENGLRISGVDPRQLRQASHRAA
jgi:DNA-binding transcriptional MerR regulator